MSKISSRSLSLALMVGLCAAGAAMPSLAAPQKKAAAPAPLADLSAEQLANAERVLTGPQQCEFSQTVAVDSYEKKAGYFELQFKGKKILIFKYKPKIDYRRKAGHRQQYTRLLVQSIVME